MFVVLELLLGPVSCSSGAFQLLLEVFGSDLLVQSSSFGCGQRLCEGLPLSFQFGQAARGLALLENRTDESDCSCSAVHRDAVTHLDLPVAVLLPSQGQLRLPQPLLDPFQSLVLHAAAFCVVLHDPRSRAHGI